MRGVDVRLTRSRVLRSVVLLELDADGEAQSVLVRARLARALCLKCGHRPRVLPCDVFPRKTYGVAVIGSMTATYGRGDSSLRQTTWALLGDRSPAHSTLHAWTEGLGAYVLGRETGEVPGGDPFGAVARETRDRFRAVETVFRSSPSVDPRRYRSVPRRERLSGMARVTAVAAALFSECSPGPAHVEWRRTAVGFGFMSPLSFRTGLADPAIEHVVPESRDRAPEAATGEHPCENHARSPPGDSNRSRPS